MKDKLQAIEWLMRQSYDEYDWNDEMLKSICIVMEETQTMFTDDEMLAIYLCGRGYGKDWRKEDIHEYKEIMRQLLVCEEASTETKSLQRYVLIKEYEGSPKLNSIIEECYSVPNQFVHQLKCYFPPFNSEYWEKLPNREVKVTIG